MVNSSVTEVALSAWKNVGCRTVTRKGAPKEQTPCLHQKADGAEDGTKHNDAWSVIVRVQPTAFSVSGPGLIRLQRSCMSHPGHGVNASLSLWPCLDRFEKGSVGRLS